MNISVIWVKNTDGRPDSVLTFAVTAFAMVVVKILFQGLHFHLGPVDFTSQGIDASTIGAVLLPTLGAYVSNRYVTLTQHPDYVNAKEEGTSVKAKE